MSDSVVELPSLCHLGVLRAMSTPLLFGPTTDQYRGVSYPRRVVSSKGHRACISRRVAVSSRYHSNQRTRPANTRVDTRPTLLISTYRAGNEPADRRTLRRMLLSPARPFLHNKPKSNLVHVVIPGSRPLGRCGQDLSRTSTRHYRILRRVLFFFFDCSESELARETR